MLVEWLKEGWLLASAEMQHSELRGGVLLLALLHSPLRYIPPAAARLLTGINRDRLQQDFVQWTQESAESVVPDADGKGAGTLTDAADTLLARYAKNMTADARNGRLDPVLCRDHEIDLMIDILCRRRKNNPVVVGEAGVGKSALIEGLALRIVAGHVPDKLKNTDIMTLDLGALQAGASVKGEFEKRFKGLMAEVISSPVPVILASESKDFRLLAHLLRTLQHAGDPHLALRLLALYVEHYWAVAAPQNMAHKKRFASQVIKRFETGIEVFSQNAATAQRDALSGELAKLAQCWQSHNAPELAQATDDLFALYQRAFNRAAPAPVPTPAASGSSPQTTATSESGVTQPSAPAPQIVIDSHDDKAWRDTLLKVAAILCERQPDSPQGYRLRRHALWQNITSTPQAESDGRTPLAAVSADMVADYHAQLGSADMALWHQVEKSVLLAPYWLDGHCLSAQTALRLGYKQVADAIRDEVIRFLERLPQLTGLLFNDHTPFISEQTKQWLAASPDAKVAPVAQIGEESKAARACFAEQGLEAALRYLDMLPEGDPRDQFHRQYLAAQLTEEAGLVQLAQQQYRMLFRMGLQMMVADREPSLLEQLEQKFTAEQ